MKFILVLLLALASSCQNMTPKKTYFVTQQSYNVTIQTLTVLVKNGAFTKPQLKAISNADKVAISSLEQWKLATLKEIPVSQAIKDSAINAVATLGVFSK